MFRRVHRSPKSASVGGRFVVFNAIGLSWYVYHIKFSNIMYICTYVVCIITTLGAECVLRCVRSYHLGGCGWIEYCSGFDLEGWFC